MKIINLSEQNTIVNQYLAEIRDKDYQKNRLLFRNNVTRVGEMMAYEISKTLDYEQRNIATPLSSVPDCPSTPGSSTSSTMPGTLS